MNDNNLLFEQFLSYVPSDALELNGALRNYDNYFNNINNMSDEINRLNFRVTEIDAEIERLSSLEVDPNWFEGRKVQFENDIVEKLGTLYIEKKECLNKISDIQDRFDGLFYSITPDESLSIKLDRMKNDSITKIKREIQELNVQYANLKNNKNDILIRFENNKRHMDELLAKNSITKEQYNESLAQMQNFVSDSQKKHDDSIKASISSLYSKNDELVNLINFIESLSVEELISYVKNRNIQQDTDEKVDEKLKEKEDREESKNNETNYDKIYLNAVNEAKKRQQEANEANKNYNLISKSGLNDEEGWKQAYIDSMKKKENYNETNYDEIYLNAVNEAEKRQQEANEANNDYNLTSKSGLSDEEEWKQAYIDSMKKKENYNETNYDEIYLNAVNNAEKRQQEVDEANNDYNLTSKSGLSDEEEWKRAYEIEANKDKTLYTLESEFDNGMYSKEASSKFDASMENMRRRWSGDFDYDSYYQAKKIAKNQYKDGEISKSEMKDRIKSAKSEYLSSVSDDEYIDYTSQAANQYMEDVKKEYSSDVKIDTRDTIEKINSDDEYNFRFQVNDASRKERLVNFVRNNKKGLMQSFLQAVYKKIGYVEEIINDDEYYDVAKSGRSR